MMRLYQRPSDELVVPSSDFTGIITVATAGTEVQGPDISAPNGFYICGHPSNTQNVWIMPHGEAKTSGYCLDAMQSILVRVACLYSLDFDADVNGEKLCYIKA